MNALSNNDLVGATSLAAWLNDRAQDWSAQRNDTYGQIAGSSARAIATKMRVIVGGCLARSVREIDPRFFVSLDYEDRELGIFMLDSTLPIAVVLGAPGDFVSIPLSWSASSVTLGTTAYSEAVVVDADEVIAALTTIAGKFFAVRAAALEVVH